MDDSCLVVIMTAPRESAEAIATMLVEARLAACVNVIPEVMSTYRWEGKLCRDGEAMLLAKTTNALFEALSAEVRKIHPYSVPEIIAVPFAAAYDGYLRWMKENLVKDPG